MIHGQTDDGCYVLIITYKLYYYYCSIIQFIVSYVYNKTN